MRFVAFDPIGKIRFGKLIRISGFSEIYLDIHLLSCRAYHSKIESGIELSLWQLIRYKSRPARRWLGLCRHYPVIQDDNSNDYNMLKSASADYDLLASSFATQPGCEWEEDECRWRAHELRRLANWYNSKQKVLRQWKEYFRNFKSFMRSEPRRFGRAARSAGFGVWALEYFLLLAHALANYAAYTGKAIALSVRHSIVGGYHIVWHWLIRRTAVGYLLQPHRLAVSSIFLLAVCALIYALAASDSTVIVSDPERLRPWDNGLLARLQFGAYFSLTTFVTLGYGDVAPTSWFKLVTGLQALAGVTLLALFTVAWGRKLVR